MGKSHEVRVTLNPPLMKKLEAVCSQYGVSHSEYLRSLLVADMRKGFSGSENNKKEIEGEKQ